MKPLFLVLSFKLLDELLLHIARHKFVASKLHDERSTSARQRTQRSGVGRHF